MCNKKGVHKISYNSYLLMIPPYAKNDGNFVQLDFSQTQ
jgi:hypothetical protein